MVSLFGKQEVTKSEVRWAWVLVFGDCVRHALLSRPVSYVLGGYGPPPAGRGAPPPPPPFTSYIVSTPPGGFPPPQGFPQGYGAPPHFSKSLGLGKPLLHTCLLFTRGYCLSQFLCMEERGRPACGLVPRALRHFHSAETSLFLVVVPCNRLLDLIFVIHD